ncbi:MAG: AAA family ATPase [Bacteroidia bacterium]
MNSLIILRGLPGSGKSTLAKELSENGKYPVFSIDDYFTSKEGAYKFEFDKNYLAYKDCQDNVHESMKENIPKIFVDNVFSIEWEIEPYFKLASQFNYRVFVLTVENRHQNKNIHDISDEQIKKMAEKYKVILY